MILALKFKVRKSLRITVQEKQQTANVVRSHIAKVTGHSSENFLHNYDQADEESDNDFLLPYPNEIIKTQGLRKSKYRQFPKSQQLRLHSPIDGSVERKQIASFIF